MNSKQEQLNPDSKGLKWDADKPRWFLMPWESLLEICKVVTFGAKKYSEDNWKSVEPFKERYFSATIRHLQAWVNGEKDDPETGLNHLAHAGCCIIFLLWGDLVKDKDLAKLIEQLKEEACKLKQQ